MTDESPKSAPGPERRLADAAVAAALRDPEILRLYANGFTIGFSNADTHIVLQLFGRPIAVWNLSYTLAKTLSEKLAGIVQTWEARTGNTIATTDKIDHAFKDPGKDG